MQQLVSDYKYGFHEPENYIFKSKKGLNRQVVQDISWHKNEPQWMTDFRIKSLAFFEARPLPSWGGDLTKIDFNNIYYYIKPTEKKAASWEELPAEIKRTYDRIGIPEAEKKMLIGGVSAQYECITGDALIFGNPSLTPLKDIKEKMYVFAFNEATKGLEKQRVLGLEKKGKRPVYKVKVAGRTIKCTESHPLYVLRYKKNAEEMRGRFYTEWEYLKNLNVGDYIAIAKSFPDTGAPYSLPNIQFEKEYFGRNQTIKSFKVDAKWLYTKRQKRLRIPATTTDEFMWLIGLYIGDGYITRTSKKTNREMLSIAIPQSDTKIRSRLASVLESVFKYKVSFDKEKFRVRIHSFPIMQLFKSLGLKGNAHTKSLPKWVFSLPKWQKLAVLGGYIDSDGYLRNGKKNSDVWITSVNRKLLESFHMLAISCGLHATGIHEFTHYADIKKKVGTKIGYRLQISGDLSQLTIYSQKVSDGFVPRAYYHKYSSHHKSPITKHISEHIGFAPISEISHSGEEDVYDIEVEGHHNFIANGIIVHNSEVVYKSVQKALSAKGVIFLDMDSGLREHPDIVKKYFGTIIPPNDNKFAALNSAVWSGGSFIYVPPGVHVDLPLQAYFRINAANMGQFERTLIIADEGSYVHYVEGCLPAGEQVSLGDRWANIESLKPGDLVADEDGELRRVKAVMTRPYKGELIEITPISSYNAFQLTPEHPVLAIKRQDALAKRNKRGTWQREVSTRKLLLEKPTYLPVNKLDVGDFIVYPQVKSTKKEKFSVQLLRLLGYYLAEGSAYIHNQLKVAVVGFSLSEKETNLIAEIKQLIFDVTGKKAMFIHDKKRHGIEIRVYSKELYDRCLLECGKGAATKQLSKTLMSLPAEQIQPLLTTYFLGDGNVCKKGNSTMCRAATTSESLARQLQELLGRLGVYASIQRRKGGIDWIKGRQISRRDQFIIVYTKNKTMGEVRSNQGHFLVPIKKVKRVPYDGFVFNMEVDKTNSYLIRGFAVHNCTAPVYSTDSLHSAVVEIIVKKGARVRYTTIQNWSVNVYNLVTKRMRVEEEAVGEWIDGNIGSKLTMKYPSVFLMGKGARGEVLSVAYAGPGQHQDAGGKAIHVAPYTTSKITSKSISKGGGRTSYRGLLQVYKGAKNVKSKVVCDALILDPQSRSDTYPTMKIDEQDVQIEHEATVSKIGEEQLFYLMSRGLSKSEAEAMVVNGFIEPIIKELPLEYAVEMNRLIQLEMEGSVG